MKKLLTSLVLAVTSGLALASMTVTDVPGTHDLYKGSKKLGAYASHIACVAAAKAIIATASYTCRNSSAVTVTLVVDPKPADQTQVVACPAGSVPGSTWTQTSTYLSAPAPTYWVAGPWMPTTPPAGACPVQPTTGGAVISALSPALADVRAAVALANDDDTVQVPAGTATWTEALTLLNKTIRLKGAGSGATHILHDGGLHQLLLVNPGTKTGFVQISGFHFLSPNPAPAQEYYSGTVLWIDGPVGWNNFRFDHNHIEHGWVWTMLIHPYIGGVLDHNLFDGYGFGIRYEGKGAAEFFEPQDLGSANAFFVEDNTFSFDNWYGTTSTATEDQANGGRQVFRHNSVKNGFWQTHDISRNGTAGGAHYEVYSNAFTSTMPTDNPQWKGIDISSGTGVVWGNTFTGPYYIPIGGMDYKSDPTQTKPMASWSKVFTCDGNDVADQNVAGSQGWRCQQQIGTLNSGPTAYSAPLYVWGNTVNGAPVGLVTTANNAAWQAATALHLIAGRDFINSAKPGYTPFTYPHPLQSK